MGNVFLSHFLCDLCHGFFRDLTLTWQTFSKHFDVNRNRIYR